MQNSFGLKFKFTTFGESHGEALGVVLDGVPAGLKIDIDFIQQEMNRRKPGKNKFTTSRKESDKIKILSGVFNGLSTGTPIGIILYNENQKSRDYNNIKNIFRPGHADFTYFHKYGIRDYRGGGRSSARETALRVASGAIAKLLLSELNIQINSGVFQIENLVCDNIDFDFSSQSEIFTLDKNMEDKQKDIINKAVKSHDSLGGAVLVNVKNVPIGLGEPMYHKLDGQIANAMMGINAVKAVEIGNGIQSSKLKGSFNNDQISSNGFLTNNSGGILGGISNGDDIIVKIYFKPTPSIFQEQQTVDVYNQEQQYFLKGRHDPCVAIRGSIVCESMMALVLADMVLLNMSTKMSNVKKIYNKGK